MSMLADQRAVAATPGGGEMPRHVAIIMDGNGRWARERGLPRGEGHRRGVEAVRQTVRAVYELGIKHLTLFSFSSENWSRPQAEVDFLFGLFRLYIRRDVSELHAQGVRINVIGKREGLPADMLGMIEESEALTKGNNNLELVLAFNYGSRDEIARAARAIGREVRDGRLDPEAIDEAVVAAHLDTASFPRPRPRHPHQRGIAPQQLPAVAIGIRGTGLPSRLLAGFRQGNAQRRHCRVCPALAALRRPRRAGERLNASRAADRSEAMSTLGRDVAARVGAAVVLAVLALAGAWLGGWVATIIVAVAVVVVFAEWIGVTGEAAWPDAIFTARAGGGGRSRPERGLPLPGSGSWGSPWRVPRSPAVSGVSSASRTRRRWVSAWWCCGSRPNTAWRRSSCSSPSSGGPTRAPTSPAG